jgi:hypothetical protein
MWQNEDRPEDGGEASSEKVVGDAKVDRMSARSAHCRLGHRTILTLQASGSNHSR